MRFLFADEPEARSLERLFKVVPALFDRAAPMDASSAQMEKVNRYAAVTLEPADVHVRRLWIANNQVDHFSTRFTDRALAQIVELLPGRPTLRNHTREHPDALPVARFFEAANEELDGVLWAVGSIYWPRKTMMGEDMRLMMDSGVWSESSLAWFMDSFTTSVDNLPVGESPFWPGQAMPDGTTVVGVMDMVTEVEEGSLVALGGQQGTFASRGRASVDTSVEQRIERAKLARFFDNASRVARQPVGDRGLHRFFDGREAG